MSDNKKDKSVQVTVAVIGCLGTIMVAIISGVFSIITVSMSNPSGSPPVTEYTPPEEVSTSSVNEFATAVFQENIEIDPSTIRQPDTLPANFTCPNLPTAGWLNFPFIWYGPYTDQNNFQYMIGYDNFQIHVWHPLYGMQSWDDPQVIGGRNQWLTLNGTPFLVCVDTVGNVFAAFNP